MSLGVFTGLQDIEVGVIADHRGKEVVLLRFAINVAVSRVRFLRRSDDVNPSTVGCGEVKGVIIGFPKPIAGYAGISLGGVG